MLASLANWVNGSSSQERSDSSADSEPKKVVVPPRRSSMSFATSVDERGRRLGLEDPDDPRLQDDPNIFAKAAAQPEGPKSHDKPVLAKAKRVAMQGKRVSMPATNMKYATTLVPSEGKDYVDPRIYGGSTLDSSAGLGEPLNVIVSALSSPEVLTRKGLQSYFRSLEFDFECLGLHSGVPQTAWLDPRGPQPQAFLYREVYTPLDYVFGTCVESLKGGNHIRAWQQQGTGAWWLALSKEQNVTTHHMIAPDGYDVGRDEFVKKSQCQKDGRTSFFGKQYRTKVFYVDGLLPVGTRGINHDIAIDGRTAVVRVELLNGGGGCEKKKEAPVAAKMKRLLQSRRRSMPVTSAA